MKTIYTQDPMDGTRFYNRKEPPPEVPEGYEADKHDPYVMRLKWLPCKLRQSSKRWCREIKGFKTVHGCEPVGEVTPLTCSVCPLREE